MAKKETSTPAEKNDAAASRAGVGAAGAQASTRERAGQGARAGEHAGAGATTPTKPRRGYAGRTAEQLQLERRARLLDAALALFGTQGYHATSIEQLCSCAQVTTRHFYEAFVSRESLFAAVYDEVVDSARLASFTALQVSDKAPDERIYDALRVLVHAYTDDPRRGRIACIEVIGVSHAMARRRRAVIHEFAMIVEAHAQALVAMNLLPKRNYHLASLGMVGASNELLTEWLTVECPPSVSELADELILLFKCVLSGAPQVLAARAIQNGERNIS